jgi:hypothetical protein
MISTTSKVAHCQLIPNNKIGKKDKCVKGCPRVAAPSIFHDILEARREASEKGKMKSDHTINQV